LASAALVRCAQTPAGPAPSPRKPERDDLELPGGPDDESENSQLDDESELDLTDLDEDEQVGLDTSTGFDDAADDLELPDDGEDERWSTDSEEVGELAGTDTDLFQGEEYGWIGDDEPNDDEAFDADIGEDEAENQEDSGAEGLEDDSELDDLDMGDLPDIDADSEEDASGSGGEAFEELATPGMVDERTLEVAPGEFWRALPMRSVRASVLTALPEPPRSLAACGTRLVVCAGSLLAFDAERGVMQALPLPAAGPSAVALTDHEGALHVAVIAAGEVFVSGDGGDNFGQQKLATRAAQVGFTQTSQRPRLWWLSPAGALHSAAVAHDLDGEVLSFNTDGVRHVVALVRRHEKLWLAGSTDAGKAFTFHAAPFGSDASTRVAVGRGGWLLYGALGVQCAVPRQSFEAVSALASGPAALSEEEGETFVYSCVRHGEDWLILRRAVRAGAAPMVMVALGRDLVSEPRNLAVSYAEGGFVTMYLATDGSLLRVDASLDGEELA
jgi:hypothetical protein